MNFPTIWTFLNARFMHHLHPDERTLESAKQHAQ